MQWLVFLDFLFECYKDNVSFQPIHSKGCYVVKKKNNNKFLLSILPLGLLGRYCRPVFCTGA